MTRRRASVPAPPSVQVRCAIYTRKSSDEGLQQDFNSLDAQREAAEAYIASQKAEGWVCLPDRYDDGGFTGGNMERPGLKQLLTDIDAGKVDCVVVYKVDRLSRSLMDFARIVETFERHNVSFVSVTQHFNTTNSMGRLTLNILLSFAQFEREIIGERIRDKLAASRQKGKWTGGSPILGYDVDRSSGGPKLVVNAIEAARVREIFELYAERGSLLSVAGELRRRGWTTKRWTTRSGKAKGDLPFDKCNLYSLLRNVLYIGKVRYRRDVFAGEHEAIVPEELFRSVQTRLQQNGRSGCAEVRNRHGALLRGLLYCKACGRVMTHTFTGRGNKHYRYYVCTNAIKKGWDNCPTKSLPAAEIDRAVVDQIRCIGQDAELLGETLAEAQRHVRTQTERLAVERRSLERGLARAYTGIRELASTPASPAASAQIAHLNEQIRDAEHRVAEIAAQTVELQRDLVTEADVAAASADFDNVWRALSPREQARLVHLLVARVEFDPTDSTIELTFHPTGIRALAGGAGADAHVEDAA
ncbi:MAG: recombinase family protein [Phycisphaerae bacterium]|nr:recombinase family protein [Phycisphaerae bacterium]